MNYLGHLYFSRDDLDLMICNLYGDFVKGTKFLHYPEKIREGIQLHRSIDNFLDTHYAVLELKKILYKELPKVSGIAVDLYFDHLLAKNWKSFHSENYQFFLSSFFTFQSQYEQHMKDEFQFFIHQLRKYRWIEHYASKEGLQKLCQGVSSKLSFQNSLHEAPIYFEKYEKEISTCFEAFMIDANLYFSESNLRAR